MMKSVDSAEAQKAREALQ
jgi:hypothetical protein